MQTKVNKLRGKMGEHDLNVSQLADLAGINRKTLGAILRGTKQPREETKAKICAALDIPLEDMQIYFPPKVPGEPKF